MTTKHLDCVEMMHRGARRIHEATKDLSRSEELEYWRQKAAQLPPAGTTLKPPATAGQTKQKGRKIVR
jgi:hypothetical protein